MKLEILLTQYLYQYHQLSLCNIGTFTLNEEVYNLSYIPGDVIPADAISFVSDRHAMTDEQLISFIVAQTGKMRALAMADLNSVLHDGLELIHIHQNFTIEGIGSIGKTLKGEYHFVPGRYLAVGDALTGKPVKTNGKKIAVKNTSHHRMAGVANNSEGLMRRWWIFASIIILIVAGILLKNINSDAMKNHKNDQSSIASYFQMNQPIGSQASSLSVDETATSDPGMPGSENSSLNKLINYNVVFEIADSNRAFSRYHQLTSWGDNIVMYKTNAGRYALAAPFTTVPTDTVSTKDSIKVLFGRDVFLDKINAQ